MRFEIMKKYYVINRRDCGNICSYMLNELYRREDVCAVYQSKLPSHRNRWLRKLLHIADRTQWELRKAVLIRKLNAAVKKGQCPTVLITNESMLWLCGKDVDALRREGVFTAALLIDPISAPYDTAQCAKQLLEQAVFNRVFTFDPQDAEKNGWVYTNTLYSRFATEPAPITNDLFYIGNIKDRLAMCKLLLQRMGQQGITGMFKLGCNADMAKELPAEVVLKKYLTYPQMLQLLQSTKCILDITQPGQSGVTLRYYEAVVFNKKLLTNNRNIAQMPFYDPRYMKFYDTVDDIDWQWVKSDDMPDYQYDGSFSPVHLLEMLN